MKQFHFVFVTEREQTVTEVKISSTGMMDALRKAKDFKKDLETKQGLKVSVKFEGVSYSNIA